MIQKENLFDFCWEKHYNFVKVCLDLLYGAPSSINYQGKSRTLKYFSESKALGWHPLTCSAFGTTDMKYFRRRWRSPSLTLENPALWGKMRSGCPDLVNPPVTTGGQHNIRTRAVLTRQSHYRPPHQVLDVLQVDIDGVLPELVRLLLGPGAARGSSEV